MALLDRVLGRQGEEHARRGQAAQFDLLKVFLTGDQDRGSTHELTAKLDRYERRRDSHRGASLAAAVCGTTAGGNRSHGSRSGGSGWRDPVSARRP